jgi:hypothetical protein
MRSSGWVGVRCVFRSTIEGNQVYEERVTLWLAEDMHLAIARAEAEALEYADAVDAEYTGLAQAYLLVDPVGDGAEVFSLMRTSSLDVEDYLDRHFETGPSLDAEKADGHSRATDQ